MKISANFLVLPAFLAILLPAGLSFGMDGVAPKTSAKDDSNPAVKVERLDPALDAIVPAKPVFQKVASGFAWTEGPIWIPSGYLLFAEIHGNDIEKLEPEGGASLFIHPSGYQGATTYGGPEPGSNGMTLDRRGRLTVAGHARRNIWRLESSGTSLDPKAPITILADSYQGKPLNSPNDLVYKSDGSLYFTDPPYGLRTQNDADPEKQLTVNGVYRLAGAFSQPAGAPPDHDKLQLLIGDLPRPNGIAFSPDEQYLYVDNSGPKKFWMRYRVLPDGSLTDGTLFFDATSDTRPGAPDGMKVDRRGNLYSAGPGGVWIFSPAGKHLGTLELPEKVSNVAWGGVNGRTLYVTASANVYSVALKIRGVRPRIH